MHLNKAPVVSTVKVVDSAVSKRLNIDLQRCEEHWQALMRVDLQTKLQAVFAKPSSPLKGEAEEQLYHNFLPQQDKLILNEIRTAKSDDFKKHNFCFSDKRYQQLLFNYIARFFPNTLSAEDQAVWRENCIWRLTDSEAGYITLDQQKLLIESLLSDPDLSNEKASVLKELMTWSSSVAEHFGLN